MENLAWYFPFNLCVHIPHLPYKHTHSKFNVTDSHHSGLMTDQSGIAALLTASLCLFSLLHTHAHSFRTRASHTHCLALLWHSVSTNVAWLLSKQPDKRRTSCQNVSCYALSVWFCSTSPLETEETSLISLLQTNGSSPKSHVPAQFPLSRATEELWTEIGFSQVFSSHCKWEEWSFP